MEQSLSSLTFTGSIPEAITEAKNRKKLFVVYISGENEESSCLEKSIWTDSHVAECIKKYCVLLHIPEGTNDATNFSAIYPQKSCPCITTVGYNGLLLWQNEGFISPEDLISRIEKAWLSLHIQETTATVLTAALSSKKNDESLNGASAPTSAAHEKGDSSSSSSLDPPEEHSKASESGQSATSENLDQEKDSEHVVLASEDSSKQKDLKTADNAQSISPSEAVGELNRGPAATVQDTHEVPGASHGENEYSNRKNAISRDNNIQCSNRPSELINCEIKGNDESSLVEEHKDSSSGFSEDTSMDRLLNIRLPNGVNLQDKFLKTDELRLVKDYVDRNLTDLNGSYDLAIPYPRKVFKDLDLDRSLAELGIINRQGLIVVLHQRALHRIERGSSSNASKFAADTDSSTGRVGGYFTYVKKMLSYVNPFSYLGGAGSSTSTQESQSGIWQYSPNPATQNNISRQSGQGFPNPTPSTSGRNDESIRQRRLSHFGSNIHTLKREDDSTGDDRNTYWNGNSTQFGGNDNDR